MDRAKPDPVGFSSLHKNKKRAAHFGVPSVSLFGTISFLVAQPFLAVLLVLQSYLLRPAEHSALRSRNSHGE
jgi:hypothetical protein